MAFDFWCVRLRPIWRLWCERAARIEYVSRKHKWLVHSKSITNENGCKSSIQIDWRQCQSNEIPIHFFFCFQQSVFPVAIIHSFAQKNWFEQLLCESRCLLILSTNFNKVAFMLDYVCPTFQGWTFRNSSPIVAMPISLRKIRLYEEQGIDENENRIFKLNLIMYLKCTR